jgi:prepilin-type processing-associated H-X9-DG protein
MSAWQDGTSQQWCFTEKFIPNWARNRDDALGNAWDGGIQFTYPNSDATQGGCSVNVGRYVSQHANLFARGNNDSGRPNDTTNQYPGYYEEQQQLGSSHPGLVNVLFGDGSVHGTSITMLPLVAARFAHTQDGVAVTMP